MDRFVDVIGDELSAHLLRLAAAYLPVRLLDLGRTASVKPSMPGIPCSDQGQVGGRPAKNSRELDSNDPTLPITPFDDRLTPVRLDALFRPSRSANVEAMKIMG